MSYFFFLSPTQDLKAEGRKWAEVLNLQGRFQKVKDMRYNLVLIEGVGNRK